MPSEARIGELVAVGTLEREEALVNKSLMPSGGSEELVVDAAAERDEAVMIVSVEVTCGENAAL